MSIPLGEDFEMTFEGTKRRTRGEINEQLYEHDIKVL